MKSLLIFVLGMAFGIGGTLLAPRFAGPYLPQIMRSAASVEGTVVAKQREPDRLLLSVKTAQGGMLVTFTKKVPEVALLVEPGDTLQMGLTHYAPFVDNPAIERVGKPAATSAPPSDMPPPAGGGKGSMETQPR